MSKENQRTMKSKLTARIRELEAEVRRHRVGAYAMASRLTELLNEKECISHTESQMADAKAYGAELEELFKGVN